MELIIKGTEKEIAAFLLEIETRQSKETITIGLKNALEEAAVKYQSLAEKVQP